MIYIFEGLDNCLKDAIIYKLRAKLSARTHVLKYSNPPSIEETEKYQKDHFTDMFSLIEESLIGDRNFILNRAHLGEYVYGPIYRKYDSSWIFDIENQFLKRIKDRSHSIVMVLLYDSSNEQLRKREDGKSMSKVQDEKIDLERLRFLEAFDKSFISQKLKFNLSDYISDNDKIKDDEILLEIINSYKD